MPSLFAQNRAKSARNAADTSLLGQALMSKKSLERKLGIGIAQITNAVAAAEKTTSAEIAVFIREWTEVGALLGVVIPPVRIRFDAEKLFVKHGLDKTRDRNAVMLYVTLRERVAVVLGDTGIHARVADGAWDSVTASVSERAAKGDIAGGIITAAVARIGVLLSEHFPQKPDHTNHLPDPPNFG